jgi:integration host factor subunit beta
VRKVELIDALTARAGLTRTRATAVVELIFNRIAAALAIGDEVELRGFGSFRIHHRRSREGRNPRTGARVRVPAKRAVLFRSGKALRKAIERLR